MGFVLLSLWPHALGQHFWISNFGQGKTIENKVVASWLPNFMDDTHEWNNWCWLSRCGVMKFFVLVKQFFL